MTGGELIPGVAAAAGKAAKHLVSETEAENAALAEIAKESPEMAVAAREYARRLAIRQSILRRMYSGLATVLGMGTDYFDGVFEKELAAKTAHIPDDRLQQPAPSVAFPAMQGLGYSLTEAELKEMYLNLLATATDGSEPQPRTRHSLRSSSNCPWKRQSFCRSCSSRTNCLSCSCGIRRTIWRTP